VSARSWTRAAAAAAESAEVIGSALYLARRNRPVSAPAEADLTIPAAVARASTSVGVSAAAGAEPAAAKPGYNAA
jgi:hypothetical protein